MNFNESNASFYDLEYYISLEYRFFSGAHSSRVKNIISAAGDVTNKKLLDVGCGGGFFAHEFSERGADVSCVDYSPFAVRFAKERYPQLNIKQISGYSLGEFPDSSFDIVVLLDVIEHLGDQNKVLSEIKRVLKPEGNLVISTDIDGGIWSNKLAAALVRKTQYLSSDGRAYRMIKKVESRRRQFKNYHASHLSELGFSEIRDMLSRLNFEITNHVVYPLVGVPARDLLLKIFPKECRGDHQTIVSVNKK